MCSIVHKNLRKDAWIRERVSTYFEIKKKKNTDRIVLQGQLSDKGNGKIEALTGDKRSEKFVFIAPAYCLPYSR